VTAREVTYFGFALIGVAAIALVLFSHRRGSPVPRPSVLFTRLLGKRTTRVAFVLAWWWIGFHFFVR
jgi:hypothetical protein